MPVEKLGRRTEYRGIGGRSRYYREPALLGFDDQAHTRHYVIELLIAEPGYRQRRLALAPGQRYCQPLVHAV